MFSSIMGMMAKQQMANNMNSNGMGGTGSFEWDAQQLAQTKPEDMEKILPWLSTERGRNIAIEQLMKDGNLSNPGSGEAFRQLGETLSQGGQVNPAMLQQPSQGSGFDWKQMMMMIAKALGGMR